MARFELFGSESCPYTNQMREWLEFRRCDFVEYDVQADPAALDRMRALVPGRQMVPVLVEDGKVVQTGWQGRGCMIDTHA
ncbi:MAG: Uxx-star family glutaredoxin-like (seleno)protein [Bryobacteraceae bacterium]